MAEPCACRSPCRNLRPAGEDELANVAPTTGSGTHTSTTIVSRATTPAPATAPAVAPSSDNKIFK